MADTHGNTKTSDKVELSTIQLQTLTKVTGMGEDEIREAYEKLWQRFPKGCLTKEEFSAKFHESELFGKKNIYPAKHLFAVADRDNSGTVDLYEYLMIMALLVSQDPKVVIKCLFKMCDSDQDGRLSQSEVVNVLYTFFQMSALNLDDTAQEDPEYSLEKIKSSVTKAFDNKTQISEQEFRGVCEKSEEIEQLAKRLYSLFLLGMMFDDSDF